MHMIKTMTLAFSGILMVGLAGCGSNNAALISGAATTTSDAVATYQATDSVETTALNAAVDSLNVYKSTKNPSQTVITQAEALLKAAQNAATAYKAAPSDKLQTAEASAIASLTVYLLTSAPGNGSTPSTVVTP
jgi:hypothetical protein